MAKKKELPNCLDAEVGILGSILLDPDAVWFKCNNLKAEDFYFKKNQLVFSNLQKFFEKNTKLDTILFAEYLEGQQVLKECGGHDYLISLMDTVLVPAHSEHYIGVVQKHATAREQIKTLEEALKDAYLGEDIANEVVSSLLKTEINIKHNYKSIVDDWYKAKEGTRTSIPTPYVSLDRQTGGLRQGMVTIFTGRSKSGKSMFLANWYNFLGQQEIPILVVPLEDKYSITIKRQASAFGHYSASELDAGGYYVSVNGNWEWMPTTEDKIKKAEQCLKQVTQYPIHYYDRKCTPKQLRGVAIRYKTKHNIQAMFIDGAKDLLRPTGKYNDVGFDEEISQQLCLIAEELNIAVIAVHHLTKIHEDERITVNNIRGSGNIVGDARAVYALQSSGISGILHEQGYTPSYDENGNSTSRILECLVNNHGTTGMKALDTDLSKCQFFEARK